MSEPLNREEGAGARNLQERICLIVNPRAGAGAAGERLDTLRRAADRAFAQWEVRATAGPGDASRIAAAAVSDGFAIVAAVGGDGTCNEVVNGLMDGDGARSRKTAFAVIPFGTGSDLVKSLGVPTALGEALWIAATGVTLPTDVGVAELHGESGPVHRYFLNVAGFGANGEVVRRANLMDKRWGGRITFLRASAATAIAYRPPRMRVTWEGPEGPGEWDAPVMAGFVANAAYCGGGMWVGKGGSMQDGAFDVTLTPPATVLRQVVEARRLYDGSLDRTPGAIRVRATAIHAEASSDDPVLVDLDGEMPGTLPASFRVLPRTLPVRGRWPARSG